MNDDKLNEIHRSMGRMEGKVDSLVDYVKSQDTKITENSKEVGKVKTRVAFYSGGAGALGILIGKLSDLSKFLGG